MSNWGFATGKTGELRRELQYDHFDTYHLMMKEYGWFDYETFCGLPILVTMELMKRIQRDHQEEKDTFNKSRLRR